MKKQSGLERFLSEWGARLTLERWERQVLVREERFVERHRHEMLLPLPSSPLRQEGIIRYRDMAGWKPLRDELREMSDIVPIYKEVVRFAKRSFEIAERNEGLCSGRGPFPASFWEELEGRARALGADLIGYAPIPRELIFQGKGVLYGNAVVLGKEMKHGPISQAPGYQAGKEALRVYRDLGSATLELARWIQGRGGRAQPVHPYGGTVLFPLMAARAGLGYPGYHGLLISKPFGPRVRFSIVSTDVESLPPPRPNEMAEIRGFCDTCRQCVRACPGEAFYGPPIQHDGTERLTHIDNKKCYPFFARFKGCSICLKVCAEALTRAGLVGEKTDYAAQPTGFMMNESGCSAESDGF